MLVSGRVPICNLLVLAFFCPFDQFEGSRFNANLNSDVSILQVEIGGVTNVPFLRLSNFRGKLH